MYCVHSGFGNILTDAKHDVLNVYETAKFSLLQACNMLTKNFTVMGNTEIICLFADKISLLTHFHI